MTARALNAQFRLVGLVLLLFAGQLSACSDPCKKLVDKLCEEMQDEAKCQEWTRKVETVNEETCEASLEALKAATR